VDVELRHQPRPIRVHGLRSDAEGGGDLPIGVPFGDELQDLPLAVGERHPLYRHRTFGGEVALDDHARDLGAQVEVAALDRADRLQQLGGGGLLEEVAPRARLQGPQDVGLIGIHREDDDLRLRKEPAELARRLDPVQERHRDVHDDDVGEGAPRLLDRLVPVLGGADDGDVVLLLQQRQQSLAHDRVIVGEEYPGALAHGVPPRCDAPAGGRRQGMWAW
jgi:hypothetical protein